MRNIPEEIVKLTEAYDYLIPTGRQQIRAMIKAAMQNGKDLPENTEYLEAKEEQARLEERIIELRALLEDLKNQKSYTKHKKRKIERPPALYERITDFSVGACSNVKYIPKKKRRK